MCSSSQVRLKTGVTSKLIVLIFLALRLSLTTINVLPISLDLTSPEPEIDATLESWIDH